MNELQNSPSYTRSAQLQYMLNFYYQNVPKNLTFKKGLKKINKFEGGGSDLVGKNFEFKLHFIMDELP